MIGWIITVSIFYFDSFPCLLYCAKHNHLFSYEMVLERSGDHDEDFYLFLFDTHPEDMETSASDEILQDTDACKWATKDTKKWAPWYQPE